MDLTLATSVFVTLFVIMDPQAIAVQLVADAVRAFIAGEG